MTEGSSEEHIDDRRPPVRSQGVPWGLRGNNLAAEGVPCFAWQLPSVVSSRRAVDKRYGGVRKPEARQHLILQTRPWMCSTDLPRPRNSSCLCCRCSCPCPCLCPCLCLYPYPCRLSGLPLRPSSFAPSPPFSSSSFPRTPSLPARPLRQAPFFSWHQWPPGQ